MPVVDFASDPPDVWEKYDVLAGRLAFDIGANGGMTARMLAANFDRVAAYEPAVECFDSLSRCPANVEPVLAAVSDEDGEVDLDVRDVTERLGELTTGDSMSNTWGTVHGQRKVRAVTIDSEAARLGDPDFVKVDTEGHEAQVVRGGLATIARCDPRLLIEVHSKAAGEEILGLLGGRFTKVTHPVYRPGTFPFDNHFWLLRGV